MLSDGVREQESRDLACGWGSADPLKCSEEEVLVLKARKLAGDWGFAATVGMSDCV